MPILKESEWKTYVGENLAGILARLPQAFEAMESAASDEIVSITGYTVPDDAANAAPWAKRACAVFVMNQLLPSVASLREETRRAAADEYDRVMDMLKRKAEQLTEASTSDTPRSQTVKIEGLYEW